LRAATGPIHQELERQIDAIRRFADPVHRQDLIHRFAAFHLPAEPALRPHLSGIRELNGAAHNRAALFPHGCQTSSLPEFPTPENSAEALGMLYVLEGSTLGGHVILRTLRSAGVDCASLAFLDPYGSDTGRRWRDFLIVLERETGSETRRDAACKGAVLAFEHALEVLCGPR
jgi:heme oxygenase